MITDKLAGEKKIAFIFNFSERKKIRIYFYAVGTTSMIAFGGALPCISVNAPSKMYV